MYLNERVEYFVNSIVCNLTDLANACVIEFFLYCE